LSWFKKFFDAHRIDDKKAIAIIQKLLTLPRACLDDVTEELAKISISYSTVFSKLKLPVPISLDAACSEYVNEIVSEKTLIYLLTHGE